jgi:putative proteasome-type protease
VRHRDGPFLMENNVDGSANFIVGGQIAGEHQRLFLVYAEGNFIEATPETPYFQIGETKYGKPIIDRVITPSTCMDDAIKCVLVSFDSTMRSNLSVGMPIDLACYNRESLQLRAYPPLRRARPLHAAPAPELGRGGAPRLRPVAQPEWMLSARTSRPPPPFPP